MIKYIISMVVVAVLVITTAVIGFTNVKSPLDARKAKFDSARSTNLASIETKIEAYYSKNSKLPDTLSNLDLAATPELINDPQTSRVYEYNKKGDFTYQLCAEFGSEGKGSPYTNDYGDSTTNTYTDYTKHAKGRHCFDLSIPTIYRDNPLDNPSITLGCLYGTDSALGAEVVAVDVVGKKMTYKDNLGIETTKDVCSTFYAYDDIAFKSLKLEDIKKGDSVDIYFSKDGKIYNLYVKKKV